MGYGKWTYSDAENDTNTYTVGSGGFKVTAASATGVTLRGTAPSADDIAYAGDQVVFTTTAGFLDFEY